jgi:hypothetical protein
MGGVGISREAGGQPGSMWRLLHPRAHGVGGLFRHRLQQQLDGLSADDLFVPHEHPVGDIGLCEFGLIEHVLAWQIIRLIAEPAGIITIRKLLHVGHPDVLDVAITGKTDFQAMSILCRLRRIVGSPEGRKRVAGMGDRSVHLGISRTNVNDRRIVFRQKFSHHTITPRLQGSSVRRSSS